MKIYLGNVGETLRKLANQQRIGLEHLLQLNPHIPGLDVSIAGLTVNLSTASITVETPSAVPPYCPEEIPPMKLEQWIPLQPLEQMAQTDYDVLIVGSGAGGGAVLWRLCEMWRQSGKRVGMIDAGDLLLPTNARNVPTMNRDRLWNYYVNVSQPIGQWLPEYPASRQLIAVGGDTLFWGAVSPRVQLAELQEWPVPLKEIDAYYNIAEQAMYVNNAYSKGSSLTETMLNRLWSSGITKATYLPMAADLNQTKYGELHSNVIFSSIIFLARALNMRSFDLAVNARAVQVITENGKATGVKVMSPDMKAHVIKAKTVVLSAGAMESPRILLHSGIQGPAIGHYFTDHSGISARGSLNTRQISEVVGALAMYVPPEENRPYMMQIHGPDQYKYYMYQYEDKPSYQDMWTYIMLAFGKVESRYENRVSLSPVLKDEYGVPLIDINYSYSDKDLAVIQQMASGVYQVSEAMQAPLLTKDGRPDMCTWLPGRSFHDTGTCRMGDNPSTSTTNRYGQVHGVPGLYIADNSMLPPIGGVSPTLSTVAMSIRTADYIIQQMK